MKQTITLLIIAVLNLQFVNAQNDNENTYYLTSEINLGNYVGVDFNFNYVFNNKYSLKLGFSGNIREPKSQPEDFSGGLNSIFSLGTDQPYDHFLTYRFDAGRIYNLNDKGTIRAHLAAGIGYTIIKEPENWEPAPTDAVITLAENYTYNYRSYNTVSLIINPKIEFPISNFFGLTVSPTLQINKDRTFIGVGIGTMLGKLKAKN